VAENGSESASAELIESVTAAAAIEELDELDDRAQRLAKESRAASTWRAYDSDLQHFRVWCAERQLEALPAEPLTVASYLAALEESHSPSTIDGRLASISVAHHIAGLKTPTADPAFDRSGPGSAAVMAPPLARSGPRGPRSSRRLSRPSATAWPTSGTALCC
jgi:hypothetical protein